MKYYLKNLFLIFGFISVMQACTAFSGDEPLTEDELASASKVGMNTELLSELKGKPLYEFSELEVDKYLGYLQVQIPDLRERINFLAHKNIGQEYDIYLLGEFPFEVYDEQPLYCLEQSDCVVFSEHTYAMALSHDWKSFMAMLQRIRYKDGVISFTTRNHYTEADWIVNNSWLIKDMTIDLAGENTKYVNSMINKTNFFRRNGLDYATPEIDLNWNYIPAEFVKSVIGELKTGDFVNVVRGSSPENVYVGHVGLISVDKDGTVYFIHSTSPEVKKQTLVSYMEQSLQLSEKRKIENAEIAKENEKIIAENAKLRAKNGGQPHPDEERLISQKPYFFGFKFLRLQENAMDNLRAIDGPDAPKLTIYGGFQ